MAVKMTKALDEDKQELFYDFKEFCIHLWERGNKAPFWDICEAFRLGRANVREIKPRETGVWTKERLAKMVALRDSGMTWQDVADELGVAKAAAYSAYVYRVQGYGRQSKLEQRERAFNKRAN